MSRSFFTLSLLLLSLFFFGCTSTPEEKDNYWNKVGMKKGPSITSGSLKKFSNHYICTNCHYNYIKADVIKFVPSGAGVYQSTNWSIYLKGNFTYQIDMLMNYSFNNKFEISGIYNAPHISDEFIQYPFIPSNSTVSVAGFNFQTDRSYKNKKELDNYITQKLFVLKQEESINRINNTCSSFGFVKGTEPYGKCIFQIMDTERQLALIEAQIKANNSKEIDIYNLMQNDVLESQLQLQNSIDLLRLGTELLTPDTSNTNGYQNIPPIRCIVNPVGWTCL